MRTIFNINSVTVASYSLSKLLQTWRKYHVKSFPDISNYFNSFSESKGLEQMEIDIIDFQ